ncbi:MAG: hypothetical protein NVSMB19_16860 [Vulcanimicrobiaceae bacterium]
MRAPPAAGFLAVALALASSPALPAAKREPAPATAAVSALDLIELQISYTTILARFYEPVEPRTLVVGARAGLAAELASRGMRAAPLPVVPARVDFGRGGDLIDTMVVGAIARYGARVNAHRLVEAAVGGELAALHDPYTLIFRPQQFKRFNTFLGNAAFGGIGAVLTFDAAHGRAPVERVIAGSPAAAAGLRAGDVLTAIDGRPLAQRDAGGVRAALRGKVGTTVRVSIERDGATQTLALVRAPIRDPEVRAQLFGAVGYLALSRFGDRAGAELGAALADQRAHGARGFVLDLRGNGGGYGDEATAVAALFLDGPVFITRERGGPVRVARARMRAPFVEPLAVLVDGNTASAAEIVAGAVQDAGIGTIVGQRTFGKGLVQSIFPLPDGSALKVTTARYTTPKGRAIDRVGIRPDTPVAEPAGAVPGDPATDPQLAAALATVTATLAAPPVAAPAPSPPPPA